MSVDSFDNRLLRGERVVWSGRPGQGILFAPRDIVLIPFSLMWGGFALFWEYMVLTRAHGPLFMQLWGIPFVLAGLFLIFGRFLLDAYIRAHVFYAITDRRILILRTRPFPTFTSLSREQLPALELTTGPNGTGTLYFAPAAQNFNRFGRAGWLPTLDSTPKFMAVENAQSVLELLMAPRQGTATELPVTPQAIALRGATDYSTIQSLRTLHNPVRLFWMIPILFVTGQILWSTVLCFGYGGTDVKAVRSFATTEASFNRGDRTPTRKFGPNDTAMALVVLNWPQAGSSAGSHRILWNWYRDGKFVSSSKYCHMRFTDSPFTLRTWRAVGLIGSGHIRVDTLIDGQVAGTTEFDVTTAPASAEQGALPLQQSCG